MTAVFCLANAIRDVVSPGTPLPFPGDDKYQLVLGSKMVKKEKVAAPISPEMALVLGRGGMFNAAFAMVKLVTVFSAPEGTYLRRNLFATFGIVEILVAANLHGSIDFVTQACGVSPMPIVAMFTFSGLVFLSDAVLRERRPKLR